MYTKSSFTNDLLSFSSYSIIIALSIPAVEYSLFPPPKPTFTILKLSGKVSPVFIDATIAAPVGVISSPSHIPCFIFILFSEIILSVAGTGIGKIPC